MNKRTVWRWVVVAGLAMGAAQLPIGCDSGTGDSSELDNYFATHPYVSDPRQGGSGTVSITPASAVVSAVGGHAVFTFNGGSEPITWDVADSSKGSISGSGNQGVYTATAIGQNDVVAYDRDGHAALASVSTSSSNVTVVALSASAAPTSLAANGDAAVLTASGGKPPYSWFVPETSLGNVASSTGASVGYRRISAGDNIITVTDANHDTVTLVISQP